MKHRQKRVNEVMSVNVNYSLSPDEVVWLNHNSQGWQAEINKGNRPNVIISRTFKLGNPEYDYERERAMCQAIGKKIDLNVINLVYHGTDEEDE